MKIEVQDHWHEELAKVRAWLSGFKAARGPAIGGAAGGIQLDMIIPGEDTLRQIQQAIREGKAKNGT